MTSVLIVLTLFIAALAFAMYVKTRNAIRALRWISDMPDRTMRRLVGLAAVPGLAATVWLIIRGIAPPAALAVGSLLLLGVTVASAGLLGVEGGLVEPESEAMWRVQNGLPPKTSPIGRAVALALGATLAGFACIIIGWATEL